MGLAVLQRGRPLSLVGISVFWLEPLFLGMAQHISCRDLLRGCHLVND
jgi:hypothetical protein